MLQALHAQRRDPGGIVGVDGPRDLDKVVQGRAPFDGHDLEGPRLAGDTHGEGPGACAVLYLLGFTDGFGIWRRWLSFNGR